MPTDHRRGLGDDGRAGWRRCRALAGLPGIAAEGAAARPARGARQVETVAGSSTSWQPSATGAGLVRAGSPPPPTCPRPCGPTWTRAAAARTRPSRSCATGCAADVPARRRRARRTGSARSATARCVRGWLRRQPRPGRGVRLGLGAVPADHGADDRRGGQGAARRDARATRCATSTRTARSIDGVDAIRNWLQDLMDTAMDELDGTHFDLADPVRVEAMIAPAGQRGGAVLHRAVAGLLPARPDLAADARPAPVPGLGPVSTWYHEGVPGHHLQLAQWTYLASQLLDVPDGRRLRQRVRSRAGRSTPSG